MIMPADGYGTLIYHHRKDKEKRSARQRPTVQVWQCAFGVTSCVSILAEHGHGNMVSKASVIQRTALKGYDLQDNTVGQSLFTEDNSSHGVETISGRP
jgi:hypothetical protein